jgi:hypothetical protein
LLSKQNGCRHLKSTCKQIIEEKNEEIKAHIIPLKEKEAIYGVNLFPKDKSTFCMHAPFSSPEPFSLGHSLKIRLWFTRPNGKI